MASSHNYDSQGRYEMDSPPAPKYEVDRPDTLAPRWYEYRYWSRKAWIGVGIAVVVVVVVIIAAVAGVEVSKKNNRYPDYSKLTYKLADTCGFLRLAIYPPIQMLTVIQIRERTSSTSSITSLAMTLQKGLSTTCRQKWRSNTT